MVVNVNVEQLRQTIRSLEQDNLTRADRGFLIRLLRELADATEKSPQMEGESRSLIQVQFQGPQDKGRLQAVEENLADQERRRQVVRSRVSPQEIQSKLTSLVEEAFTLVENLFDAYIYTYEGGRLSHGAARSADDTITPAELTPRPSGMTYTVARLGQTLVVPDMASHPLFAGMGWTGSIIGIPLKVGPRVVGVFTACRRPVQEFSPDEIRLLQVLADQAAIEIENGRVGALAEEQIRIDPTTGLHNRRAFDERLQAEMMMSQEINSPFSIFLIGIDGIREVNRRYGRSAADYLLAGIATAAAQALRKTDFIARYDDTRWGLILSRADRSTAQAIAERIQESVQKKRFSLPEQAMRSVSLSMGIAIFPENGRSTEGLVDSAGRALLEGQAQAPGSVYFAGSSTSTHPPTPAS